MERLTHKRNNGIKDGYWSPNKKDELVARLAQYENTGLTPEDLQQLQHKGNTNADRIRSMSDEGKPYKMLTLNENSAVLIRFTERIIKDYMDCKEKASVPGGPGKNCFECALDIPENEYCLRSLFPEIDKELEKRMVGELK